MQYQLCLLLRRKARWQCTVHAEVTLSPNAINISACPYPKFQFDNICGVSHEQLLFLCYSSRMQDLFLCALQGASPCTLTNLCIEVAQDHEPSAYQAHSAQLVPGHGLAKMPMPLTAAMGWQNRTHQQTIKRAMQVLTY